jgi:two-component system, NtrC family, sensor kinase
MTAMLDGEVADLRRANAELQRKLDERTRERDEALQRETATAEILRVINASRGDLAPIFDTLCETAARLCRADAALISKREGEAFRVMATFSFLPEFRGRLLPPGRGTMSGRTACEGRVVHIADISADPEFTVTESVTLGKIRTALGVPLLREGTVIGTINLARRRVEPFTERQIELVRSFADQAVIGMENARLLTETREALEQQTATAEVLQVINSSPGKLTPVFDAMLEKAVRLCDGSNGILWTFDGERARLAASRNMSSEIVGLLRQQGESGTHPLVQRVIAGDHLFQFDLAEHDAYRSRQIEAAADIVASGVRTIIWVALVKDGSAVGAFVISRQEVRPFTDTQIALLQNFATQAVIAMENARLLTETREALEQQTATTEVLQVINASPGDLQPVFDAMLHRAMRLCAVDHAALELYDGERMHAVAVHGASDRFAETLRNGYQAIDSPASRALLEGGRFAEIADATRVDHVAFQAAAKLDGVRTVLFVPLRRDDAFLGMIASARREVRPFSEKEIALLENFASQAVIAIENARLLNEIRQRQQELRVTFDNMVDGVAMFDTELRLAAWNRNFQQLLALPDEFLTERHDFDTYIRYLTERGEFGEADPETQIKRLRDRLGDHYSFERTRPDGTVIEVRHNPMPDGGVVLIYSDITERKRSEAEIRAARDAAEAAYRDLKAAQASLIQAEKMASLGQLTAGIAHEIKNPLNFVNNFAGLSVELLDELKETAAPAITALDDDKRAEIDETIEMLTGNLEKIAEHGRRADNIVKSMLEHSRGSSGERRSVDLNGLIEEALNLAYHGARAQDQSFNITLERDLARGIAPIELVPQDITRLCLNLFGNGFYAATKRQKEGGDTKFKPTLKVSTRDLGDAVEFRIRDNGIGIAPEIKDKLFQPFFTTKPTGEGTGLGLSISYDIVTQQHGGTIEVDSRVGEFTEFTVRLPRRATMAEAAS